MLTLSSRFSHDGCSVNVADVERLLISAGAVTVPVRFTYLLCSLAMCGGNPENTDEAKTTNNRIEALIMSDYLKID